MELLSKDVIFQFDFCINENTENFDLVELKQFFDNLPEFRLELLPVNHEREHELNECFCIKKTNVFEPLNSLVSKVLLGLDLKLLKRKIQESEFEGILLSFYPELSLYQCAFENWEICQREIFNYPEDIQEFVLNDIKFIHINYTFKDPDNHENYFVLYIQIAN